MYYEKIDCMRSEEESGRYEQLVKANKLGNKYK